MSIIRGSNADKRTSSCFQVVDRSTRAGVLINADDADDDVSTRFRGRRKRRESTCRASMTSNFAPLQFPVGSQKTAPNLTAYRRRRTAAAVAERTEQEAKMTDFDIK